MASPPLELHGFGVDHHMIMMVVHCTPAQIHQISSRLRCYGASTTGSLALHRLASPRRTRTVWQSRHVSPSSGPLATLPAIAQVRLPSGFNRTAATTRREGLSPSSINQRYMAHSSAAKKLAADFRI